ncbi:MULTISPECIES: cobalamin-binding protein [Halolamina]|uniref:Iron complex transport system substrate-binding protein n=1 Tax=Halolamina pelagica TaxID=699431 RepID=A0A1I5SBL7_9EURY|nr:MULTISPECIES: cobalamin-binding protein [Halolamina]NHX37134.1 cobalamin-binding protein [Halolamina sp. R1-12]SFP68115.1 iron complex transport system substrate-binding protein [Halolamina pelagica]
MRLVSLAPSATATLSAMAVADDLVGATVHCDLSGVAADPERVGGWLNADLDRVEALSPDLVLTSDALQRETRDELRERGLAVHHAEPGTLDEAVEGFADLGRAVGDADAGAKLAAEARERLRAVRAAVADEPRPTVYCEEWADPPMAAGNWVPEAVDAAGGAYPFAEPGERSSEVTAGEVAQAKPDYVILHPCGKGDRTDPDAFRERGWALDAEIHVVDDSLLNQPSPNLIGGIERLAEVLHGIGTAD